MYQGLRTGIRRLLSSRGFWLFVILSYTCLLFYGVPPALPLARQVEESFPQPIYRVGCWLLSITFLCICLGLRTETRFSKRIAALSAVYLALEAILAELYVSVSAVHLIAAQEAVSALVQITSVVLVLAEIRNGRRTQAPT